MEDKEGFHAGCAIARFHSSHAAAIAYDILSYSPIFLHGRRLRIMHSTTKQNRFAKIIANAREASNVENRPVNMSHSLFISNLPWKKEIEAEELQKTLENAGIHGVILVKVGEYMD